MRLFPPASVGVRGKPLVLYLHTKQSGEQAAAAAAAPTLALSLD